MTDDLCHGFLIHALLMAMQDVSKIPSKEIAYSDVLLDLLRVKRMLDRVISDIDDRLPSKKVV